MFELHLPKQTNPDEVDDEAQFRVYRRAEDAGEPGSDPFQVD
jgi:hypothetical protein